MEKVNHIVITRKEEKALKELNRLFEIMGVDLDSITSRIETLEAENEIKSKEIVNLRKELAEAKKENEELIRSQMAQISVNIQKSTAKEGVGTKSMFNFEGKKIDEHF